MSKPPIEQLVDAANSYLSEWRVGKKSATKALASALTHPDLLTEDAPLYKDVLLSITTYENHKSYLSQKLPKDNPVMRTLNQGRSGSSSTQTNRFAHITSPGIKAAFIIDTWMHEIFGHDLTLGHFYEQYLWADALITQIFTEEATAALREHIYTDEYAVRLVNNLLNSCFLSADATTEKRMKKEARLMEVVRYLALIFNPSKLTELLTMTTFLHVAHSLKLNGFQDTTKFYLSKSCYNAIKEYLASLHNLTDIDEPNNIDGLKQQYLADRRTGELYHDLLKELALSRTNGSSHASLVSMSKECASTFGYRWPLSNTTKDETIIQYKQQIAEIDDSDPDTAVELLTAIFSNLVRSANADPTNDELQEFVLRFYDILPSLKISFSRPANIEASEEDPSTSAPQHDGRPNRRPPTHQNGASTSDGFQGYTTGTTLFPTPAGRPSEDNTDDEDEDEPTETFTR